jgi:hypothetical protein
MALKHPWAGARLVPMAANVQWELWDCGAEGEGGSSSSSSAPHWSGSGRGSSSSSGSGSAAAAASAAASMRGIWVRMLHNEREVPFPACSASALGLSPLDDSLQGGAGSGKNVRSWTEPSDNVAAAQYGLRFPCPWETVKRHYREVVYGKHGIGTCDAGTWEEMCGGLNFAGEGCSDESE